MTYTDINAEDRLVQVTFTARDMLLPWRMSEEISV